MMLAIPRPGEPYAEAQLRGIRAARAGHVTLADVMAELLHCGFGQWRVERLGGNVLGLVDYRGRTITLDGGLDVSLEPNSVDLLFCQDGAQVLHCEVLDAAAAVMAIEDALSEAGL